MDKDQIIQSLGYQSYMPNQIRKSHTKAQVHLSKHSGSKIIEHIGMLFDLIPIKDGMTLSFHHHLRNGDYILNLVLEEIKNRNLKHMTLAPSSIFPIHEPMVELIKSKNITNIVTNYVNGTVAKAISEGYLDGLIIMDTHGGRPRAIETGELMIDVAFIATPTATIYGDGHGRTGQSACGSLGYAISDMYYAKHKVVMTDHLVDQISHPEIKKEYIDYVIHIDSIGNPKGILSGTTRPTKDPVQLKIVRSTMDILKALDLIQNGLTFQTGAGGTSIAVAKELKTLMKSNQIKGRFASGGITSFLVEMLEEGLFETLYDVQCFDLIAVESLDKNTHHIAMSASEYANINHKDHISSQLDVVILGATEVDLSFNVNVTTDSNGYLIGGSGGHSDTAHGAKVSIITTNLMKARLPIIKDNIITKTTPGDDIDIIVTERGVAVNPKRHDLIEKFIKSNMPLKSIEDLYEEAIQMTGIPKKIQLSNQVIGMVRYRDGSIIDLLYKVEV